MATSVAVHSQQGFHTPQQSHPVQTSPLPPGSNPAEPVWQNPNPPLPRGRAPRDPLAVSTKLPCTTLQDMETKLREYLDNLPAAPEHCTCELTLWAGASFLVKLDYVPPNLRGGQQPQDMGMLQAVADFNNQRPQSSGGDGRETTLSVLDALQQLNDPKETMKRQRAISKVCVASVQKTDGYRYSFHNSWKSGEDNAYRFSYYCNDSLLNKDRVANGKSGSQGKRATKPVYDCKGVLSIKFSATRQCIDVVYKHIPCHETYEERAPPPRKNSKRRAEWEAKNPERIKPGKASEDPELTPVREPAKKKKKKDSSEPAKSAEAELREQSMFSLLELMRPEEPKKPEPPPGVVMSNVPVPVPAAGPIHVPPQAPASSGNQIPSSRRQPKKSTQCAVCTQRRTRCDGGKPKCKSCAEKGWFCFYQAENMPNAPPFQQPQASNAIPIQNNAPPMPAFDPVQAQSELTALTLANQNEDLQKEIASFRQDQLSAQKEALELKNQLTEMKKQLDALKAENSRLNQPAQPTPQSVQQSPMSQQSNMTIGHERNRSSQQHHHLPTAAHQQNYAPQYQPNTQHMYHQATPNQVTHARTHGQPLYQTQTTDNRGQPPNAWNQGMYGAYQQQSQHSNNMLPNTHMMGYRGV